MRESIETRPVEQPEQNSEEQKYQEIVGAIESIYEASLNNDRSPEIDQFYTKLKSSYEFLKNKLAENAKFFKVLPTINKMAKIYENFSKQNPDQKEHYIYNLEAYWRSNDAKEVLYQGLLTVDEKTIAQLDETNTKDFFESLKLVLTHDADVRSSLAHNSDARIEWAVNFLDQRKDLFKQLSEEKELPDIQEQFNGLQDFLKTREFERALVNAIQKGTDARRESKGSTVEIKYGEKLLREILSKYGLDPDECLDSWTYDGNNFPKLALKNNLDTIFNIEDQRPGITRLLHKEFNIRNFGRYPEPALIAQFDEFDNIERPYGIMLGATHDWNNNFSSLGDKESCKRLFDQIKARYSLRIVEASSAQGVARRLIKLNQKYGEDHKIAFGIGVGHGTKDYIILGSSDDDRIKRQVLTKKNVAGPGGKRLANKFFEPNPPIVLISCSTGIDDGIGQKLSEVWDARLTAPDADITLADIEPIITDKGIDFKVKYTEHNPPKTGKRDRDIVKTYSKGSNIK